MLKYTFSDEQDLDVSSVDKPSNDVHEGEITG